MQLLESILSPADVKLVPPERLPELAAEIRRAILETVSRTGGHLASSLGSVELSIALLRVFSPPGDRVVWDVGHQTYAWKLLTGRRALFPTLRQLHGLSGFPKPAESPCDPVVSGHAGVALSAALGLAVGRDLESSKRQIVAVVGDGAMANGISLEALNSLEDTGSKIIVVLNDNEMSISENVGALSRRLGRMLADVRYNRIKRAAEAAGHRLHMTFLRRAYHRVETLLKSLWLGNAFFEELGLRYVGPIDGHDPVALEHALRSAREDKGPVLIHVATQKGRGFRPAERRPRLWHGVGPFELNPANPEPVPPHTTATTAPGTPIPATAPTQAPATIAPGTPAPAAPASATAPGTPTPAAAASAPGPTYSRSFGDALCALAEADPRILAVTAAMRDGTGLAAFAERFPSRFFDVGICEGHAVAFAAGLAVAGFRPVFAVYSTFLQRAVDCVMHDVCLARLPVLLCIDRAGVVGADGPTHHGLFDIPMLRCLPNLTLMQPRGPAELAAMLRFALRLASPCAIRYPRGPATADTTPAPDSPAAAAAAPPPIALGRAEVVEPADPSGPPAVWIWALGDLVPLARRAAAILRARGKNAGVVNARFIKPLDRDLLSAQARRAGRIATLENGALAGGFGSAVREALAGAPACRVDSFGWPDAFIPQGKPSELAALYGLTPENIAASLLK